MRTISATAVRIRVLLFARFAELLGTADCELALPAPATVRDVLARVRGMPGGEAIPERPLCAIGLEQVRPEDPVCDGDEVALLPPLAGG